MALNIQQFLIISHFLCTGLDDWSPTRVASGIHSENWNFYFQGMALGVVTHAFNPSTAAAKTSRSLWVLSQPELHNENWPQNTYTKRAKWELASKYIHTQKARPHLTQAGLQRSMQLNMILSSCSWCLCLPRSGITRMSQCCDKLENWPKADRRGNKFLRTRLCPRSNHIT